MKKPILGRRITSRKVSMKEIALALTMMTALNSYAVEYIVKVKNNNTLNQGQLMSLVQINSIESHSLEMGEVYLVDIKDEKELRKLRRDSRIEYIEENVEVKIDPIEGLEALNSDPSFNKQWGLKNDGTNSGTNGKAGVDIRAEDSWTINQGDKRLKIAVIDTGVDYNHEDLKANIWVNQAEADGEEGVDDDGNGFIDDIHGYDFVNNDGDPMDDNKHGTHCAGIIAGLHNTLGIRGVMKDVQIVPVKFLSAYGGGTLINAVKAIDYATKVGVDIMSNSWGGGGFNESIKDAIEKAKEKGIVFIAAAGNSRNDNDTRKSYPASYDLENVISVGSHNGSGLKSGFSNYGKTTVDVMAPGSDIYSTVLSNQYRSLSGTSMATPFVSGIAGLLLSLDPALTPKQIKERLIATSVATPELNEKSVSNGRVDAFRALRNITE